MQISKLFKAGMSFNQFIETDEESYRENILETLANISFEEEYIEQIKNIDKEINILIYGEIWCVECIISIPVIEKMREYNENISISILNKEAKIEHGVELEERVKLPTFIVYDKEFNKLGVLKQFPNKLKEIIDSGNESNILVHIRKYRKGEYAQETLKDILDIINRRD